ncbi:endonuclease [Flavobacterium sp. H122]|uniref:endonuclease n=1 Tax=Flavobacterium sp. H122 TaxID=2529860 RepID=UPI0010AAB3FA|nr:endonuclease [Flavobacterium sp. H122]
MKQKLFFAVLGLIFSLKAFSQVVINELDADQASSDYKEFVEFKSSTPNFSLDGYVLVFFNAGSGGTSNASYRAYDLDGIVTNVNGIATIGGPQISPVPNRYFANEIDNIQNGPDAIGLYLGNGNDFPTGTAASATNLVDAIVYHIGGSVTATAIIDALNLSGRTFTSINENLNASKDTHSIQRKNDGSYDVKLPTPGANNDGSGFIFNRVTATLNPLGNLTEGNNFQITFSTQTPVTGSDLNLIYSIENGTFTTDDYTGSLTATIPVGSNNAVINFSLIDDVLNEGDETLILVINQLPSEYELVSNNINVRIHDNDYIVQTWGNPLNPTHGLVSRNIPAGYYDSLEGKSGNQLKQAIQDIIADPSIVREHSYADVWDILKEADTDPANSSNVWLMYVEQSRSKLDQHKGSSGTGKWNREHIYCQSRGDFQLDDSLPNDGIDAWLPTDADDITAGGADAHHIRAEDSPENSSRNNKNFGVDPSGTDDYNGPSGTAGSWRGDVSRAIFYMCVRYNGLNVVNGFPSETPVGNIGDLATLLAWNKTDSADDFEMNRNNVIYNWQKNRNPFIDYPELADYVFGSKFGQTWSATLSNDGQEILDVIMYPNPSNGILQIAGLKNAADLEVFSITGQKVYNAGYEPDSRLDLNLTSGVYLVKIKEGNKTAVKKLIIK